MLLEAFHAFSFFSGFKPDKSKCERAGIGLLKRVNVALCSMECVNLEKDTIKTLGIHYSLFIIHYSLFILYRPNHYN